MMERWRLLLARYALLSLLILNFLSVHIFDSAPVFAQQQPDIDTIVRGVDASVKNRLDRLASYTVTEHYAVFRGKDESHPAAEMLVKTTYRKESGKSYDIVSQSGSGFWRNEVLATLLDNEKHMSQPGNVETALVNSSNYEIKLDPNARERLNGRDCLVLDISPRRASQFLFNGKIWVDARDYAIAQLKGTASKSAFFLASAAQVTRQYDEMNGLPMATHAEAISGSGLLGQTVVKIDYINYQIELFPGS
jgi:outer membrane lipoprotein-sorting protein